jgi:hypothetical protein
MAKKLKLDFDGWPDLVAALSRKPYARLRSKAKRMRKAKRRMKTLNKRLDANRKMNRAIELEVNGLAARGARLWQPPRWPLLLDILADGREQTLSELSPLYERDRQITRRALQTLAERGLVEMRRNPDARLYGPGFECCRPHKGSSTIGLRDGQLYRLRLVSASP